MQPSSFFYGATNRKRLFLISFFFFLSLFVVSTWWYRFSLSLYYIILSWNLFVKTKLLNCIWYYVNKCNNNNNIKYDPMRYVPIRVLFGYFCFFFFKKNANTIKNSSVETLNYNRPYLSFSACLLPIVA